MLHTSYEQYFEVFWVKFLKVQYVTLTKKIPYFLKLSPCCDSIRQIICEKICHLHFLPELLLPFEEMYRSRLNTTNQSGGEC